jgi:O-antigen/teichoic acid export membrane protein
MQLINQVKEYLKNSPTTRNILKVSFGDATSKILSVAVTFLLIRGLSVADYANYITFSGISYLFSGLVGAGINMALIRYSADTLSRGKEKPVGLYPLAFLFQLLIYGLLAAVCLVFPAQGTTFLLSEPALAIPLRLGLFAGLGVLIVQFGRALYQAEEKFNHYIGTIWLVQAGIFFCLMALWLVHALSFNSAALVFTIVQLGVGFWLLVAYLGSHGIAQAENFLVRRKNELKRFIAGSALLIGYFVVLSLFSRMDILMLLRFQGEEEVAIYGVAFQYYSLALLFLGSVHAVLLPKFSRVEMQNSVSQKVFFKQWLQWNGWLILPILLFDILGKPLFVLMNGKIYEQSFPIFVIFSLGIWLSMMFSPLVNVLIGEGKFRFLFFLSSAALILNILLNLLLVPQFGGIGAAVVVIATYAFINISTVLRIIISTHS